VLSVFVLNLKVDASGLKQNQHPGFIKTLHIVIKQSDSCLRENTKKWLWYLYCVNAVVTCMGVLIGNLDSRVSVMCRYCQTLYTCALGASPV